MKKVLIAYASYGGGHKTVAEYVYDYLKNNSKEYEVKMVDLLKYTGRATNFTISAMNYIMHHRMEKLFSFLYKSLDHKFTAKEYKKFFKRYVYKEEMAKEFIDFDPDIVISSHFYGSNMASVLNKAGKINAKLITIVTDYQVHEIWMTSDDPDESFVVANDIVKDNMIDQKCYSKNIYPFGIPFNERKVKELPNRPAIFKKHGLDIRVPVITFFGGGSIGSTVYIKYLKALLKKKLGYQIVFICGRSEELKKEADELAKKYPNLKVYGFTNDAYELMDIADVVISKPGGATVTECLELQKYMVLIPGVGGQEKYNAKFVKQNAYGIYLPGLWTFRMFLRKFKKNPKEFTESYNQTKYKNESLRKIKELVDKIAKSL